MGSSSNGNAVWAATVGTYLLSLRHLAEPLKCALNVRWQRRLWI